MKEELKEELKPKKSGVYIELGGLDGVFQSNTKWLQDEFEWAGILIEPSPNKFNECVKNRPNNSFFNCACVSFDYGSDKIKGDFIGTAMSSVGGKRKNRLPSVEVDAKTLQEIMNLSPYNDIDFLSLDVEGYELEVLKGIYFTKQKIIHILIEVYINDQENIFHFMEKNNYTLIGCISNFTKETHPGWDGTHNDYLFKLNT